MTTSRLLTATNLITSSLSLATTKAEIRTLLQSSAGVDWPLLAQSQLGEVQIRFMPTTVPEAQSALISLIKSIETNHVEQEDLWLNL